MDAKTTLSDHEADEAVILLVFWIFSDLAGSSIGGEGGIRTHVQAINPQPDFESGPLRPLRYLSALRTATNLES